MMNGRTSFATWLCKGGLMVSLCLLAAGCGSNASITGKVTYQNKPVTHGSVVFQHGNGQIYRSEISENGTYTVNKVPPGDVKITVTVPGPPMGPPGPAGANMGPPKGVEVPAGVDTSGFKPTAGQPSGSVNVPDKYSDFATSGLTYTVTAGSQTHDIELK